jgi:hypothetical protein
VTLHRGLRTIVGMAGLVPAMRVFDSEAIVRTAKDATMASSAAMSRLLSLGVLACLVSGSAWQHGGAFEPMPRPDEGAVIDGAYTNKYFDLSYPLPAGWTEGLAGPDPSQSGYYVLKMLVPQTELTGMILIAAQDLFFAPRPFADAMEMTSDLSRAKSELEGATVDHQPSEATIASRSFSRVDVSGFGLFDSTFVTHIRCHLVSFNLTANSRERLAELAQSVHRLADAGRGGTGKADPACVKNHARPENVLTRVHPVPVAPIGVHIPVRIIVAADGTVKHVHAIHATADQRASIEVALRQWKLRPYEVDGQAVEVETGLVIQFTPQGSVRYVTDRPPPS